VSHGFAALPPIFKPHRFFFFTVSHFNPPKSSISGSLMFFSSGRSDCIDGYALLASNITTCFSYKPTVIHVFVFGGK